MRVNKTSMIEITQIIFGIILMNFGFYFFLLPYDLVTGGVSGIAVILNTFGISPSLSILLMNIAFAILGLLTMGKNFFFKVILGSLVSPLVIFILEFLNIDQMLILNQLTESRLLISSLLGALGVGFGLGIVFRNGGSTGGIDILQNIMNKKYHLSYNVAFIFTDGIIVLIGLLFFRNIEHFLFSVGVVILSGLIIDNISILGRAGQTLFIVTEKEEEVKLAIFKELDRGTTVIDAKGGYSGKDKKLVICVTSKRELNLVRTVVDKADPDAFTFIAQTKEAVGRGFSRD
ncbi:MAG: YitT family protein [Acholeplasmataceae bacterium]|nr:YitT family protein [Acholeplasmataceae bacterium]